MSNRALAISTLSLLPLAFGFTNCGGALFSDSPAPDMEGAWDITYSDVVSVEIELGGAAYTAELGLQGGSFTIEYEGEPLTFDLQCEREDVICPSEVWFPQIQLEQRDEEYPNRVWMPVERQVCDGDEVEPAPEECGEGTENPDCEAVCSGEIVTETVDAFGLISEEGDEFAMLLGAGVATNGVNCAMLGVSVAEGELVTNRTPEAADEAAENKEAWTAEQMSNGVISVGYTGACLWADDVDGDEDLEAVAIGATLIFRTGFEADRAEAGIL
jgi:hypothetical protein